MFLCHFTNSIPEPLTTQILSSLLLALPSQLSILAASTGVKRDQCLGENASPCWPQSHVLRLPSRPATLYMHHHHTGAPSCSSIQFIHLQGVGVCSVQPLLSQFTSEYQGHGPNSVLALPHPVTPAQGAALSVALGISGSIPEASSKPVRNGIQQRNTPKLPINDLRGQPGT